MPNLVEIIVKSVDETTAGFAKTEAKAKESGARAGRNFSEGMKPSIMGIGKALVGAFAITEGIEVFKGLIERGEQAEKTAGLVEAAIKSTGGAAHVSAEQVSELARSISEKTGKDELAIQSGDAMLLTFRNIRNVAGANNDIFNQATSVLTDMTSAMHGGDVSAEGMRKQAIQLGKALNDPIKGMTALRRVGVQFTQSQQQQIKDLVNTGHQLEAQKLILKELNTEFGGAAEGSSTAIDRIKNSLNILSDDIATAVMPALTGVVKGLDAMITGFTRGQKAADDLGNSGFFGFLGNLGSAGKGSIDFFKGLINSVDKSAEAFTNRFIPGARAINSSIDRVQGKSEGASESVDHLGESVDTLASKNADLIHPTDVANQSIFSTGKKAEEAAPKIQSMADKIKALSSAEFQLNAAKSWLDVTTQQTQQAKDLSKALDKSHNSVAGHTKAERDSLGTASSYIGTLIDMAKQAGKNREKQDEVRQAIERVLPKLENVRGKTSAYRDMVQKLKDMLQQLARVPDIHESIFMRGKGTWGIFGKNPVNSGLFNAPGAATGTRVPGYGGGDRHLYALEGGEAVVSKETTAAHAGELAAWGVPGMASGGIAGRYSGGIGSSFRNWIGHDWNASLGIISNSMASEISKAFRNAMIMSFNVPNVGSGVARWGPLVTRVLRMEGLNPMLAARVMYQMQTESGGNPNAINLWDSNAAAGDPSRGLMQVIGSTFRAYHWPGTSWNIYNPMANIAAAVNYGRHVYGPTLMSGGMGIGSGHGYDNGGWLPTGLSLAYNGTGRPEPVGPTAMGGGGLTIHVTGGAGGLDQMFVDWLRDAVQVYGGGDVQEAFGA